MIDHIHDNATDGHRGGGRWEDLGEGRYRRIADAPAAPKTKKKKAAAKAKDAVAE